MKKICIFALVKVEDAIQQFVTYVSVERRLAESTVHYYVGEVRRFCRYLSEQGILWVEEIGIQEVREWQMSMVESRDAAGTATKRIAALRAWFKFLLKRNIIDVDVMAKVVAPKQSQRLPVFFREAEVEQIYGNIYPDGYDGELDKLILRMLYETGMRRSELAGVAISDIDLSKLEIKVKGKRDKERVVPIEAELAGSISKFLVLRKRQMDLCAEDNRAGLDTGKLLVNGKGKEVNGGMIYRIVERYMSPRSTAARTSPHVFRHTFATHMLNEGANLDAIKELLGHSDLSATEVYTHVTRERLKETYKHAHPRANKK